jgi:large subunit ribosomal protein L29
MKIADVRSKSDDELAQEVLNLRKEQMNMRFQKSGAQLEDTSRLRRARRTVARIKTVQKERAQGVAVSTAAPAKKAKTAAKPKAEKVTAKAPAKKTKAASKPKTTAKKSEKSTAKKK